MRRTIVYRETPIVYELTYKPVKNLNLRITADGQVAASAPRRVRAEQVDAFLLSKGEWILMHQKRLLERQEERANRPERPDCVDMDTLERVFEQVYRQFAPYVPQKPVLVLRSMKTRWGSCTPGKCKITLNRALLKTDERCIEYVLAHEFTHFLHPDHSKRFYAFLERMMPDYRERKKHLEELADN